MTLPADAKITKYPNIAVTTEGELWKRYRKGWSRCQPTPNDGYLVVQVSSNVSRQRVHRLVYETFVGPIPADFVIDHINGIRSDNRLVNLRLATHAENMRYARPSPLPKHVQANGAKYVLRVAGYGKNRYGGTFATLAEALEAREPFVATVTAEREREKARAAEERAQRRAYRPSLLPGFKQHPSHPTISASPEGAVAKLIQRSRSLPYWKRLAPRPLRTGYTRAMVNDRGYAIHRLVYETFTGPIPSGMVIDHINGIKHDNRVENLRTLTPQENVRLANNKSGLPMHVYRAGKRFFVRVIRRRAITERYGFKRLEDALEYRDAVYASSRPDKATVEMGDLR